MRRALGRGGLPSRRSPADDARLMAFRALDELLRLLDEYQCRIDSGERCRLVEREHVGGAGRLVLEFAIEAQP
jgi:hypothetical protein